MRKTHEGKRIDDRRRWNKNDMIFLRPFLFFFSSLITRVFISLFFFFNNVLYAKAKNWENAIKRMQEAGGRMSFEDVDEDTSSLSKNGSKVEPVSLKEPWYTWFSLWSRSLIASFVSSSPLMNFFECFGRSISKQKEKLFHVRLIKKSFLRYIFILF